MFGLFNRLLSKKNPLPRCSMVVVASGTASRMEGVDKVMFNLNNSPILVHSLRELELCPYVDEVIVVTRDDLIVPVGQMCKDFQLSKVRCVVVGGSTRSQSVLIGLNNLNKNTQLVGIHDGARPFISQSLLDRVISKGHQYHAAAPGVPVVDTIKRVNDGLVTETVDRSQFYAIQTPQVFDVALVKGALHKAVSENWDITDDCSALERMGVPVTIVEGAYENIKITTQSDLSLATGIMIHKECS